MGSNDVQIRVDDGRGGIVQQNFTVTVTSQPANLDPVIVSAAPPAATVGHQYAYDPQVEDPEYDPLQFALDQAPAGMSIDPLRGTIRWLPQADQLGGTEIVMSVVDAQGGTASETFTLVVRGANVPPVITSVPPTEAAVGTTYLYALDARDLEGDPLVFALDQAPTGMVIDAATGQISWTPDPLQLGSHDVTVRVDDHGGGVVLQTWRIEVGTGLPNRPPVIRSLPPLGATTGAAYAYQVDASDPEGNSVTIAMVSGPAGMTVDGAGLVSWTPTAAQSGVASVTLSAADPDGGVALQSYAIRVQLANTPPEIHSQPKTTVAIGGTYQYDVHATDPEGDPLVYRLTTSPQDMTMDRHGRIRWTTDAADLGSHAVEIAVADLGGKVSTQSFSVDVTTDQQAPRVTILMSRTVVHTEADIPIRVSASDNVAVTALELTFLGVAIPIDERGNTIMQFPQPGDFELVAMARDAAGNVGTTTLPIRVLPSGVIDNATAPVVAITTPAADGIVTAPTDVIGTVSDDDLRDWTLSWAPFGTEDFTEIGSGTTVVQNGVLGQFDPTLLPNDAYVLRLDAADATGQVRRVEQNFGVSGELKLGNFRLSFVDLSVPVSGIDVTVSRTYDSLSANKEGDLGFGWKMDFRNVDLRVSIPGSGMEDIGIFAPMRVGAKVYITLPGGSRQGWTFNPVIRVLPGFGDNLVLASPRFTPDPGVTSTLSVGGGQLFVNAFGELFASGNIPWNPAAPDFGGGYTLTTVDGTRYRIDGVSGELQSITDRNNNQLEFSEQGVLSSTGKQIQFERDTHGRITAVIDPMGQRIEYGYDASGDLSAVTDREGVTTHFKSCYLSSLPDRCS